MAELTTYASRKPATFIAGTVFGDEVRTSTDVLAASGLANWDVRLREIHTDAWTPTKAFEAIGDLPGRPEPTRLGIHGERYHTSQNETVFGLLDHLSPRWMAAGSFNNGRIIYGQIDTDRRIIIDPEGAADEIQPSVNVLSSHDGSGSIVYARSEMRLDCFNQWLQMKKGLVHSVKIRHTASAEEKLKTVARAWKENNAYFDAVEEEANRLYAMECTDKKFFAMVKKMMGDRPELNTKGAQTKYDNSLELYSQAWRGQTNEKVYGTRYGAFQAMIERNQWGRTITNTANGVDNFAMAGMGLDGPTEAFRARALELCAA